MDNCSSNHLYIISFTAGADSGLALVSAALPSAAISILKNSGSHNGNPEAYSIIQCRDIGMSSSIRSELLLESYVNALVAFDAIVSFTNKFIGRPGDDGLPGKSAYQIALDNGYIGTEQDWLNSLVSPNAVLYIQQNLSVSEKEQARQNIGAGAVLEMSSDINTDKDNTGKTVSPKAVVDYVGDLSDLETEVKDDLVSAINEAAASGSGSDPNAVKYIEQTLTDIQKSQARANIAACSADAAGTVEPVETNTAVLYTAQELTVEQKAQARTNIGAGTSSFSGSYNDLTNKPTIPPLSNNLPADKSSTTKAASAKDTYDAAHPAIVTSLPAGGMLPNVYYKLGTLTGNVTFNLAEPTDPTIVNHYFFSFSAGDPVPTITWPSGIVGWASGVQPTITSLVYYEISILDGYAAFLDV